MLYASMHPVLVDIPDELYDEIEAAAERAQMPLRQFVSLQIHKAKLNGFFTSTEAKQMPNQTRPKVASMQGDPDVGKLSLSRKPGESIVVDGPAEIVFLKTDGATGRFHIYADRETRIDRGEVADARARESED